MFNKIIDFFFKDNIKLPLLLDTSTNKNTLTGLFAYVAFILACLSVIAYHFRANLFVPCTVTISFWLIAVILYMIRHLNKAKIDLEHRTLDLENDTPEKDDNSEVVDNKAKSPK